MFKRIITLSTILLVLLTLIFLPGLASAKPAADAPFSWGNGADGDLTIPAGSTYNINSNNHSGRICAGGGDGVSYEVTALTATTATLRTSPAGGCLKVGDEFMLINLQGSAGTTGNYESLRVQNLSANLVTFTTNKTRFYGAHAGDDSGLGSTQHVVLQRVPNYNNVTLNGNLVANSWDGTRYGFLVFKVKGNWIGSGTINLDGAGYRGGKSNNNSAYQGESWSRSGSISNVANGGGGAGRASGDAGCPGGEGNYGGGVLNPSCASPAGNVYGVANLDRIYLGSGGGGRDSSDGGRGGGAVFVMANNANFLGSIVVRGQKSETSGGGSGGSIRIEGGKIAVGSLSAIGDGTAGPVRSGFGRIALYYGTIWSSSSANPAPYTQKVTVGPTASATATRSQTADLGKTGTAISLTLTAQAPGPTADLGKTATSIVLTLTAGANTPDYNATGTALAKTATALAGTPNYDATATADALTATAQAGTPDYNATGTALALTATALVGTPDYDATATADALTATAQAGTPDYNTTGTALAETATALAGTPDYNATATADALTATAQAAPTETPDFFASATAMWLTATAQAATFTPTPDYNATGTALAKTATAVAAFTSTPDLNATGTAQAQTATAAATNGTPSSSNSENSSDGGTVTPSSFSSTFGTSCNNMTLNVYVYIDGNNDSMMAAQGEGVNSLEVDFLDTSYGKVGQSYTFNGKSSFCIPDYMRGQTLRVDIPYLQRTGVMQATQDGANKNQPLEMWFRLDPPTLPIYIP